MRIIHFWSISADGQRKRTRTERYFRVARLAAIMTVKRRLLINHAGTKRYLAAVHFHLAKLGLSHQNLRQRFDWDAEQFTKLRIPL